MIQTLNSSEAVGSPESPVAADAADASVEWRWPEARAIGSNRTGAVGPNRAWSVRSNRAGAVGSNRARSVGSNGTGTIGSNGAWSIGSNRARSVGSVGWVRSSIGRSDDGRTVDAGGGVGDRGRGNDGRRCDDRGWSHNWRGSVEVGARRWVGEVVVGVGPEPGPVEPRRREEEALDLVDDDSRQEQNCQKRLKL